MVELNAPAHPLQPITMILTACQATSALASATANLSLVVSHCLPLRYSAKSNMFRVLVAQGREASVVQDRHIGDGERLANKLVQHIPKGQLITLSSEAGFSMSEIEDILHHQKLLRTAEETSRIAQEALDIADRTLANPSVRRAMLLVQQAEQAKLEQRKKRNTRLLYSALFLGGLVLLFFQGRS